MPPGRSHAVTGRPYGGEMAESDQNRWDERYASADAPSTAELPLAFADFAVEFASTTNALEIACGAGRASVWLAQQGVHVTGYDISAVAIGQAMSLANDHGVADRCSFETADLDAGIPAGPPVDLIICHLFRDSRLDQSMLDRLLSGGLVAVAALSEVGAAPGRFRVPAGELTTAFEACDLLGHGEGDGVAWIVGRKG